MKIKLFNYKILIIILFSILGFKSAYASCESEIRFEYHYADKNYKKNHLVSDIKYIKYSFASFSNKDIKIYALMSSYKGDIIESRALYLSPFKKDSIFVNIENINLKAVQNIHYSCVYKKKAASKKKEVYDPLKVVDEYNSRNDFKNYWWVLILLVLGAFFLYTTTVKKPLRKFNKIKTSKKTESRIARYWAGHDSLAFSFWGVCTLLLGVASIPLFLIDDSTDTMSGLLVIVSLIYSILFLVGAVIAYVGCWRSAGFYIRSKQKKKDSAFWGYTTYVVLTLSVLRDIIRMTEGL